MGKSRSMRRLTGAGKRPPASTPRAHVRPAVASFAVPPPPPPPPVILQAPLPTGDAWTTVRAFMQRQCGVSLSEEQRYLLDARLGLVAREEGFSSVDALVAAGCAPLAPWKLCQAIIEALTTHETFFFRDAGFWQFFEKTVLPKATTDSRGERPIRIWSAACSTGQEPYTIAMLIAEQRPELLDRLQIWATDVAEASVEKARRGVYSSLEVNRGLGAHRLVRFFEPCPGGFRIKEHLRRPIIWSQHNLLGAKPDPTDCDVVLCRNVLIYFNDLDRSSVVQRLARAATPGGLVGVGCTEFLPGASLAPGWYPAPAVRAGAIARPA